MYHYIVPLVCVDTVGQLFITVTIFLLCMIAAELKQVALLSQRGRAMYRYLSVNRPTIYVSAITVLATSESASDLPLRKSKYCSVLFGVVIHAGCDKQDSMMRGGLHRKRTCTNCYKLRHGRLSRLLTAFHQSLIRKPDIG